MERGGVMAAQLKLEDELEWQFQNELDKQFRKTYESGQTLYHYTSLQSLIGMMETDNLWMSKGNFLNDSSELIYFANVLKTVIGKMQRQKETELWKLFVDELEAAMGHFLEQIEESGFEVYIFSMSHTQDSLALWYNYAKGEGYNLGFYAENLLGKLTGLQEGRRAIHGFVEYDRKEQELLLMNFLIGTFKVAKNHDIQKVKAALSEHFFTIISSCAIFFKDPAFKSEEEYRIALMDKSGELQPAVRFRAQNGVIIPYIALDFNGQLPLSHITIGPKNNIDIAKRGMEHYLKSKGYDIEQLTISKSVAALRY